MADLDKTTSEIKEKDYGSLQKYIAYVFDASLEGKAANQSVLLKTIRETVMGELKGSAPYGVKPTTSQVVQCIEDAKKDDKKAIITLLGWCTPILLKYFHKWGGVQDRENPVKGPDAFISLAWETLTKKQSFEETRKKIDGIKQDLTTLEDLDKIPVEKVIALDIETVNTKMGAVQYFNFDKVSSGDYLATFAFIFGRFLISSTINDNGLKYQIRRGVDEEGNEIKTSELVAKLATVQADVEGGDKTSQETFDILDVSAFNDYEQKETETEKIDKIQDFEANFKKFPSRTDFIKVILKIRDVLFDPDNIQTEKEKKERVDKIFLRYKQILDKNMPGVYEEYFNDSVFSNGLIQDIIIDKNQKFDKVFKKYAPQLFNTSQSEELEESIKKSKLLREMASTLKLLKLNGSYLHKSGLLNNEGFMYYFELCLQYAMHGNTKGGFWKGMNGSNGLFYFPNLSAADLLYLTLKLMATGKVKFPEIIFQHRLMNSGGKGGKKPLKDAYMLDYDLRIVSNYFVILGYDPYTVAPKVGEILKKVLDSVVIGYLEMKDLNNMSSERAQLAMKAVLKWKRRYNGRGKDCTNHGPEILRQQIQLPPPNELIEGKEKQKNTDATYLKLRQQKVEQIKAAIDAEKAAMEEIDESSIITF